MSKYVNASYHMIMTVWIYFNPDNAAARNLSFIMHIYFNSVRKTSIEICPAKVYF